MAGNRVSFFSRMRRLKKDIYNRKDVEAAKIFTSIDKYVRSGHYSSYRDIRRFVELALGGYSDKQMAERMGINASTVRWREHELSLTLYGIFGDDFFDLMGNVSANREKLRSLVYLAWNSTRREDVVPMEVISRMEDRIDPSLALDKMSLEDCYEEIGFLENFSIPNILRELGKLDVYKLDYLLRVAEGSAGSQEDQYTLLKLFNKEEV